MKAMVIVAIVLGAIGFGTYSSTNHASQLRVLGVEDGALIVEYVSTGDQAELRDENLVSQALKGKIKKDDVIAYKVGGDVLWIAKN